MADPNILTKAHSKYDFSPDEALKLPRKSDGKLISANPKFSYLLGGDETTTDTYNRKQVDCSHLVNFSLILAGYNIPYESTGALFDDSGNTTEDFNRYFEIVKDNGVGAGDLIAFQTHIGIVETYDSTSKSGTFFGSQSATGPAKTDFGPNSYYWGSTRDDVSNSKSFLFFFRPKSELKTKNDKQEPVEKSNVASHQQSNANKKEKVESPFGFPIPDKKADQLYKQYINGKTGFFPIGANNFWHGGIHFETDSPLIAIFEGHIRAYRLPKNPEVVSYGPKSFKYSNGFVLVEHNYTTKKGNKLKFWALYMHILPHELFTPAKKQKMPVTTKKKQHVVIVDTLRVRSSMDKSDNSNILEKKLKKGDKLTLKIIDDKWGKLVDADEFIFYKDNTKEEWIESDTDYDKVVLCDIAVKKGDILGYSGMIGSDYIADSQKLFHFEIFSDDTLKKFIENPNKEGERSVLHIKPHNKLKQLEKLYETPDKVKKTDIVLKKNTSLKIFQSISLCSKDYICVGPSKMAGVVQRVWLGTFSQGQKTYSVNHDYYSNVNVILGDCLGKTQPVKYEYKCDQHGNKVSEDADTPYRYVSIPLSPNYPKRYWIKRTSIANTKSESLLIDKDIDELYLNAPDAVKFDKDVEGMIAEESFLTIDKQEKRIDHQGFEWFKVKVPTNKDVWHFFVEEFGLPSGDKMIEGWISVNHSSSTYCAKSFSWNDWSGFHFEEESGKHTADGIADIDSLSPKLKSVLKSIDNTEDGVLSMEEVQKAIKDQKTAARLVRCICKSPSEWDYSDSKYDFLNRRISSPVQLNAIKDQLKKLSFWNEIAGKVEGFPSNSSVWHIHPLAFILQMQKIGSDNITPDTSSLANNAEFKVLVATVYGEAAGCSEVAWRAVASVIMNRLIDSGCTYYIKDKSIRNSVQSIIEKTGFDAYTQKNKPFLTALNYLNHKGEESDSKIDRMIEVLAPIYQKTEKDNTGGAVLYYSPKAQKALHEKNPDMYDETPNWDFEQLKECTIKDLDSKDDFKFYKYK